MSAATAGVVYEALKTIWLANVDALDGLGMPYRDEAPSGTTLPYTLFVTVASRRISRTSHSEHWEHLFRFHRYAKTPEQVEEGLGQIASVFNALTPDDFSLRTGHVISFDNTDEKDGQDDKRVNRGYLEYRLVRSRPRLDRS